MARDPGQEGPPGGLFDRPATTREDPRPPAPERRLERHRAGVVHGGHVGGKLAEPLARGRDHRPGEHRRIFHAPGGGART